MKRYILHLTVNNWISLVKVVKTNNKGYKVVDVRGNTYFVSRGSKCLVISDRIPTKTLYKKLDSWYNNLN